MNDNYLLTTDGEKITIEQLKDFGKKLSDIYLLIDSYQLQIDLLAIQDDIYFKKINTERFLGIQFDLNDYIMRVIDDIGGDLLSLTDSDGGNVIE
ncbi:hypothetical protein SAMN04488558_11213 [Ignavigranum ruoffiae]|uniref:Uncharacterized protein n=1 Tax=Ignavigranum ruoffiae TaxID=89093 RepID=A0A1H9G9A5_9LACT|nr:hypothetical protein [Ignavigranum ruoffiae]SEQ46603.1 hypothetical protein SAMN04488558_11213 [Ignavigranum ruoffiae]